ncbi:hypothetical protein FA014_02040 [Cellulomonas hominis]|uniref:Uncharacterized protein n=1 Tax=Cellulomonas hominis TaxID=156981 RepID=A0A7Z8K3W2_9CELL|nr:hypothetical protein [Cellulomonas hominis]TKR27161.1 hypothetical protein FA014_02040 [Cellulomonas hominis]
MDHWTDEDDRAVEREIAWDQHVRSALKQSRHDDPPVAVPDAQADRLAAADAAHRTDRVVVEALALIGVMFVTAVIAVALTAVWL